MNKTLIISKEEALKLLTFERCIPKMKEALVSIAQDKVNILPRFFVPNEDNSRLAIMSGACNNTHIMGAKVIVFGNKETAQGIVPLFCTKTGRVKAITDAKVMTKVRTSSTSAAATDILAKKDSSILAILGGGNQGKSHAIAISKVRDIQTIYIWSYKQDTINSFEEYINNTLENVKVVKCSTVQEAVKDADIICTTTAGSDTPILKAEWLKKGVHINAIGACSNQRIEVDLNTMKLCKVYTDHTPSSISSSGNFAIPIKNNEYSVDEIIGEVGDVVLNKVLGRENNDEYTLFSSVGLSIQDIVSANIIYEAAVEENIGVYVQI